MRSLVKALLGALAIDEAGALNRLARDFHASDTALAGLVEERLPAGEALLVVVDQLEEAFTLADAATLARFDAVLAEALQASRGRMYLVTTIRSNFVGRFEALPGLGALLNRGAEASRYLLEPMSAPALREAIERPVEREGMLWEAGLVERVLEDASAAEGGLPLVAHVLRALWVERRAGKMLGHAAYDASGGERGADEERGWDCGRARGGWGERARRMLLKLVKMGGGRGMGGRRRAGERWSRRRRRGARGAGAVGDVGRRRCGGGGSEGEAGGGGEGGGWESGARGADPAVEDASGWK